MNDDEKTTGEPGPTGEAGDQDLGERLDQGEVPEPGQAEAGDERAEAEAGGQQEAEERERAAAGDVREDGEREPQEQAGDTGDRQLTDEERAELYRRQLKELHVVDIARDVMLTLVTVGYQKMGLTDETRELRDLDDARLSIELLRGMLGALEGVEHAEELETYRSTLAQMQLNYARVAS